MHLLSSTSPEFWLLLGVVAMIMMVVVALGSTTFTLLILVATLLGIDFLTDVQPWMLVSAHPTASLLIALGYTVTGLLWAVFKWRSFIYQTRDRYLRVRTRVAETFKNSTATVNLFNPDGTLNAEGEDRVRTQTMRQMHLSTLPPKVSDFYGSFLIWATCWPFSMAMTVSDLPVRRAYQNVSGKLQGISDKAFFGID